METSDIEHNSDDDKDYDLELEKDISDHDSEEKGDISDDDPHTRHEKLGEEAPPYHSEKEIVPLDVTTKAPTILATSRWSLRREMAQVL